jgi:MoaE-MoaD fusion protein
MKVRVLMFGALAERAARSDEFDLADATARDVVDAVALRYPHAKDVIARCAVAVNLEIADEGRSISDGDEVALLPPMSGGAVHVALTPAPRVPDVVSPGAGGTAIFVGTVRDACELGAVEALEYSAYAPMAEKVLHEIAEEAVRKWDLCDVAIEHGIGNRSAGEVTFVVSCGAAHRQEAFDACSYVVDEVKARAPIWKKEIGPWGARWVGL